MERLYNNIVLPEVWPPKNPETTLDRPLAVPYLQNKPDVIDISVGRQLFVDDFLIAQTDLQREEGRPQTRPQPLLEPETEPWGQRTCFVADPEGNLIEIGSFNRPFEDRGN